MAIGHCIHPLRFEVIQMSTQMKFPLYREPEAWVVRIDDIWPFFWRFDTAKEARDWAKRCSLGLRRAKHLDVESWRTY